LVEILKQCGRLKEFKLNPQAFMIEVAKQIKRALQELIIAGSEYELIDDQYYEMHRFDQEDVERYLSRLYKVQQQTEGEGSSQVVRTPYNYIEFDSTGEEETALALDDDENVRFFCKLPEWFKVQTPLGGYNPDWAIVTEDEGKLYLVRETKSTHDSDKRRNSENLKIKCGKAHFKKLGVDFKVVIDPKETIKGHSQEELL
jgi:type III restriction enzyme